MKTNIYRAEFVTYADRVNEKPRVGFLSVLRRSAWLSRNHQSTLALYPLSVTFRKFRSNIFGKPAVCSSNQRTFLSIYTVLTFLTFLMIHRSSLSFSNRGLPFDNLKSIPSSFLYLLTISATVHFFVTINL